MIREITLQGRTNPALSGICSSFMSFLAKIHPVTLRSVDQDSKCDTYMCIGSKFSASPTHSTFLR